MDEGFDDQINDGSWVRDAIPPVVYEYSIYELELHIGIRLRALWTDQPVRRVQSWDAPTRTIASRQIDGHTL